MAIKHIDFMNRSILYLDLEGSASDFEVIDLGQKAKKLIKLGSRTELFVLYNLTGVQFTRNIMLHLKELMEHSALVHRRVMFGVEPRFDELVKQSMLALKLGAQTRYAANYPLALNLLVDDAEWSDRRNPGATGAWQGAERRHDPRNLPGPEDVQKTAERLLGKQTEKPSP